jgi:hypothetical protein
MIHQANEQFHRMFRAIYDPGNNYLVHVDRKAGPAPERATRRFLLPYPNAGVMKGRNCVLAGWSMVEIELAGIDSLLHGSPNWDFLINLSGACFPLRTQAEIRGFLDEHPDANFMNATPTTERPRSAMRAKYGAFELRFPFYSRIFPLPIPRPFVRGAQPYTGSAWHILSRRFCDYVVHSRETRRFKTFYRNVYAPEEAFFQTVLMNSTFWPTLVNNYYREIEWPERRTPGLVRYIIGRFIGLPHSPTTFRISDRERLFGSTALFARKFDAAVDNDILIALEGNLRVRAGQHATPPASAVGGQRGPRSQSSFQ